MGVDSRSILNDETDRGRLSNGCDRGRSVSGDDLSDKYPLFSEALFGGVMLKLLFKIFSDLLFEREIVLPLAFTSNGITLDLVFFTSNGIIRTPGFGDGGFETTIFSGFEDLDVSWLASGVITDRDDRKLELLGADGTGGNGGLELLVFLSVFELTTSSLITLTGLDLVGVLAAGTSSTEELDELEPRRSYEEVVEVS